VIVGLVDFVKEALDYVVRFDGKKNCIATAKEERAVVR
jgi:hypothetical protein